VKKQEIDEVTGKAPAMTPKWILLRFVSGRPAKNYLTNTEKARYGRSEI
jgi:hypothetical protein